MLTWIPCSRLLFLPGFFLIVLVAACGSSEADSEPTATPTPTPAPPISEAFLGLPPDATFEDVMERVPEEERACVQERLGPSGYGELVEQPAFGAGGLDFGGRDIDPTCFSSESLTGLIVAGIDQQAGGLSIPTVRCIEGTLGGVDLARVIQQGQTDEASQEGVQQLLGAVVPLILCLTEEEASQVDVGGATGGGTQGLTLQDLRCVLQRVDVSVLTDFLTIAEAPESTPSSEDQQRLMELIQAFQACGIEEPQL